MARITRKELKKDTFTQEVTHAVEYISEHKQQAVRYGVAALAVLLLAVGFYYGSKWRAAHRAQALAAAFAIEQAPIGPPGSGFSSQTYPTEQAREAAAQKAFAEVARKYAGSKEAIIARYFLATAAAHEGRLDEAERMLTEVARAKDPDYASLAQLSLAEVYAAQGKTGDAEKLLRALIAKPTLFVSKAQATLTLARLLGPSKPDEARKLVEPLTLQPPPVSRAAFSVLNQLPRKRS